MIRFAMPSERFWKGRPVHKSMPVFKHRAPSVLKGSTIYVLFLVESATVVRMTFRNVTLGTLETLRVAAKMRLLPPEPPDPWLAKMKMG